VDRGERAVRFIESLTLPKGKLGKTPFTLQPWQRDFVRKLFGTLTPDGLRQYRTALLLIPKKNGKSTLSAAIALYCLFAEPEIGGEIYSVANTRDQASIVFNAAAEMVRNCPHLYERCRIIDSTKRIVYPPTGSIYRALSADTGDKNGLNPSVVIYDEVCEAPTPELWAKLETGTAERQQPLMLAISTSGVFSTRHLRGEG
jgi:phage terminase large subunit-like protein